MRKKVSPQVRSYPLRNFSKESAIRHDSNHKRIQSYAQPLGSTNTSILDFKNSKLLNNSIESQNYKDRETPNLGVEFKAQVNHDNLTAAQRQQNQAQKLNIEENDSERQPPSFAPSNRDKFTGRFF